MLRAKNTETDKQIKAAYDSLKKAVQAGNYVEVTSIASNLEAQGILVSVLNTQDFIGNTALFYNVMNLKQHIHGEAIFKFLLEKGTNPAIKNKMGKVAFELISNNLITDVYNSLSEDMKAKIYVSLSEVMQSKISNLGLQPNNENLEYAKIQLEQSAVPAPLASVPASVWQMSINKQKEHVYNLLKAEAQEANDAQVKRYISELEETNEKREILTSALNFQDFIGNTILPHTYLKCAHNSLS